MNAPIPNSVVEYSATEAGLAELRTRLADVVFDCTTKEGDESARKARRELVTLRTSLDKLRLQLNADDQARIKARNDRAKEIEAEIRSLEEPIDREIKAVEARIEEARQARIKAEAERIRAINLRIDWIRGQVVELADASVAEITEALVALRSLPLTVELYAEFLDHAREAHAATLAKLTGIHERAIENAAEAARLAEERRLFDEQKAESNRQETARLARIAQEDAERGYLNAWDDGHREYAQRVEDGARKFLNDWDDANREDAQRIEDAARAIKQRTEDAWREAERKIEEERLADLRAERQRQEQAEIDRRRRERDEIEKRADPWAALYALDSLQCREGVALNEDKATPYEIQSRTIVCDVLNARTEIEALERSSKPAEAAEAALRG